MRGLHILILEDDLLEVMTLRRALTDAGCKLPNIVANNGEHGLDILETLDASDLALILVDLNMPRMNGIEFIRRVKRNPRLCVIPMVVLTTSNLAEDRQTCFELGVAGYFVKSSNYAEFVATVELICAYWQASGGIGAERVYHQHPAR